MKDLGKNLLFKKINATFFQFEFGDTILTLTLNLCIQYLEEEGPKAENSESNFMRQTEFLWDLILNYFQ